MVKITSSVTNHMPKGSRFTTPRLVLGKNSGCVYLQVSKSEFIVLHVEHGSNHKFGQTVILTGAALNNITEYNGLLTLEQKA
jgi:hypothetical protein